MQASIVSLLLLPILALAAPASFVSISKAKFQVYTKTRKEDLLIQLVG